MDACRLSDDGIKKEISANQMKRTLNVAYKTARYLCHRVRKAIEEAKLKPQLNGVVEVDETYVGDCYDKRGKRGPTIAMRCPSIPELYFGPRHGACSIIMVVVIPKIGQSILVVKFPR